MEDSSAFATIALPLALLLIMGSLGLSLTPADFRRIFTQPRGVIIGLANLLLLSPLLAFGMAELFGLGAILAVGLVLLGSTPGGTTANLFTHLARGETALSVSMTALSSLFAAITVPLYLGLAIGYFDAPGLSDDVSVIGTSLTVFGITVVPLAVGMAIRARRTDWAIANEGRAKLISAIALAVVIVAAIADEWDLIRDNFTEIALACLALNVLAMTISFTIARAARLGDRQATAVAMELGVHNGTVAIAVAATIDLRLAAPAAVYSIFMFATGGLFARIMSRRNAGSEPDEPGGPLAEGARA